MATQGVLASLFTPLVVKAEDAGTNYLIAHQQQICDELRSIETDKVEWVKNELLGAVPKNGLEANMAKGEIDSFISNLAQEIVTAIPAENEVLLNTVEAKLESLSAAASGS